MRLYQIILLILAVLFAVTGFLRSRAIKKQQTAKPEPDKKSNRKRAWWIVLAMIGIWLFLIELLAIASDKTEGQILLLGLGAKRVQLFGLSLSRTVIDAWIIIAVLLLLAVLIRVFYIPKFKSRPKGIQNVLEGTVESISKRRRKREKRPIDPAKRAKRKKILFIGLVVTAIWLVVVGLLALIFGKPESEGLQLALGAERVNLFGLNLSRTIIDSWIIIAVLTLLALLIRIFCIPKFTDKPKGLQNLLEAAVEALSNYSGTQVHTMKMSMSFGAYLFTLVLFMVGCAILELFGERAPTADLTMTFAMALITFFLLNYYGIKHKGIKGRLKSLGSPTKIILPIRMVCDLAIPVSLACRLFGNMLGGMIVMDLLYSALGSFAVGIPSVIGLYFNVFHPLIQAFIFVTLTLSYIEEATE